MRVKNLNCLFIHSSGVRCVHPENRGLWGSTRVCILEEIDGLATGCKLQRSRESIAPPPPPPPTPKKKGALD